MSTQNVSLDRFDILDKDTKKRLILIIYFIHVFIYYELLLVGVYTKDNFKSSHIHNNSHLNWVGQ